MGLGIYNDYIRELTEENDKLRYENDVLELACDLWRKVHEDMRIENDELKRKLMDDTSRVEATTRVARRPRDTVTPGQLSLREEGFDNRLREDSD